MMIKTLVDSKLPYKKWSPCATPGCSRKVSPEQQYRWKSHGCCYCEDPTKEGHAWYCIPPGWEIKDLIIRPDDDEPDSPAWEGNFSPPILPPPPPPPHPEPRPKSKQQPRVAAEEEQRERQDAAASSSSGWWQEKESEEVAEAATKTEEWKPSPRSAPGTPKRHPLTTETTPPWRFDRKEIKEEDQTDASQGVVPWNKEAAPWRKKKEEIPLKRQRQATPDEELAIVFDYFEESGQTNQKWINTLRGLNRIMGVEQNTLESACRSLERGARARKSGQH